MIDLHLHTTASDGGCSPEELVSRAKAVGLRAIAVTDHDTMAAVPAAAAAAADQDLAFVPGIEITSVCRGRDAHVLAYGLPPDAPGLAELIADQRRRRVERAREIAAALARLDVPIDVDALVASAGARTGKAIARPQIAQALIAAGHVCSVAEAFERFLGESCPAYVPHSGATPAEVVSLVVGARGIASLAHPGHLDRDDVIPELVDAGLGALEAFHPSHDAAATERYLSLARRHDLSITGGSDYHGEGVRRAEFFGVLGLPVEHFAAFLARMERTGFRPDVRLGAVAGPAPAI